MAQKLPILKPYTFVILLLVTQMKAELCQKMSAQHAARQLSNSKDQIVQNIVCSGVHHNYVQHLSLQDIQLRILHIQDRKS